jgi:signal transduction histidine kinase
MSTPAAAHFAPYTNGQPAPGAAVPHGQRPGNLHLHHAQEFELLAQATRWQPGQSVRQWAEGFFRHFRQLVGSYTMLQAALYLDNPAHRHLELLGGYALPPDAPARIPWGKGMVGQLAKTPRPVFWNADPTRLQGGSSAVANGSLVAVAARGHALLPLVYNDKLVGALEFSTVHDLPPAEHPRLTQLAGMIAAALENILTQLKVQDLFEQAQKANDQLRLRETALENKVVELNILRRDLEKAQKQLAAANQNLEAQVQERTAELQLTLRELTTTQDQLVFSEKMAALGQLVAGVAHEINSPIGAIKGSVSVMQDILPNLVAELPALLVALGPEGQPLFQALVQALNQPTEYFTPTQERKLKKQYAETLQEAQCPHDTRDMASLLVESGFRAELEPHLPLLTGPLGEQIVRTVYHLGQLKVNLGNIGLATDKTKKVVYALKSYAHSSDGETATEFDLGENVDTVLIIYQHQLKHGIDLTVEIEPGVRIVGFPDQLSQVWTNLIQNALQAMNHQGRMHVRVWTHAPTAEMPGGTAHVAIEDGGPGIPPEIRDKIFEPFFTTKKRGEGTGLGLDIVQKIVRKHSGHIHLDTQPGRTCFTTVLPLVG